MIAEVLAFARDTEGRRQPVSIRPLLTVIAAEARERGGAIDLSAATDGDVMSDPVQLRRAIENLVQNAIDHAGGGRVELAVDTTTVVITVADRGPGIAPGERARLLRPFERGERSRNRQSGGTGLGLSIVADFAAHQGGTCTLGDSEGGGVATMLSLPRLIPGDRQASAVSSAG